MLSNLTRARDVFSQAALWKKWVHLVKFVLPTRAKGITMIQNPERGPEPVTCDSMRPLRGLHTASAREAVLRAMSQQAPTLKAFREACKDACYEMWATWQWNAALEQGQMEEEKRMWWDGLCFLLYIISGGCVIFSNCVQLHMLLFLSYRRGPSVPCHLLPQAGAGGHLHQPGECRAAGPTARPDGGTPSGLEHALPGQNLDR